jgi:hypothetical protein
MKKKVSKKTGASKKAGVSKKAHLTEHEVFKLNELLNFVGDFNDSFQAHAAGSEMEEKFEKLNLGVLYDRMSDLSNWIEMIKQEKEISLIPALLDRIDSLEVKEVEVEWGSSL